MSWLYVTNGQVFYSHVLIRKNGTLFAVENPSTTEFGMFFPVNNIEAYALTDWFKYGEKAVVSETMVLKGVLFGPDNTVREVTRGRDGRFTVTPIPTPDDPLGLKYWLGRDSSADSALEIIVGENIPSDVGIPALGKGTGSVHRSTPGSYYTLESLFQKARAMNSKPFVNPETKKGN